MECIASYKIFQKENIHIYIYIYISAKKYENRMIQVKDVYENIHGTNGGARNFFYPGL
jgi:hypothetical protein